MRPFSILFALALSLTIDAQQTIDLSGTWKFRSEREQGTVVLPGSMLTNGKGDPVSVHTQWTGSLYDSSFYFNPYMEKYRHEGQMKFPFFLTPERHYVGYAWYERTVVVPKAWKKRRVVLFLERPHIETTVSVNGREVGHQTSLSVPHQYDVTPYLKFGKENRIVIQVYNGIENVCVGQDSHSVTDQTQGNWNGIVGRIELQSAPMIWRKRVIPHWEDHTIAIVRRYVERNSQPRNRSIRVVREPDNGLYDAMNKAIGLATGAYLVFLNAGDRLHEPTTIEQIVKKADWHPDHANYAVLYGETDLVDNEGNFLRHRRLQVPEKLSSKSFRSGMLVCHQSFYVRTDLAKATPYNLRYRYSGDYDWCIRIMQRAERRRLRFLNTGLILTDYLSEGITTQNHRRSLFERFRLMAHHYGWGTALAEHFWFVLRAIIKR